ncbi:MAG: DUF3574 domain-containing protein [Alphaproteobacteria bacterium]
MMFAALVLAMSFAPDLAWSRASTAPAADADSAAIRAFCKKHRHGTVHTRTELFFGLSKPDGGTVSEADFRRFMETEVTPRFPAGLTVLDASGQYRDSAGKIIQEDSKLVVLHYPYSRADSDAVEAIRKAYKDAFQQESVLRVDKQSCVSY